MSDNKQRTLKAKLKLSNSKKGKKTLRKGGLSKDAMNSSEPIGRDLKKIQLIEMIFKKKEQQELKKKLREQKRQEKMLNGKKDEDATKDSPANQQPRRRGRLPKNKHFLQNKNGLKRSAGKLVRSRSSDYEDQKHSSLESKLMRDEAEMKELLKEKNWYPAYVQKIIQEQSKSAEILEELLKEEEKQTATSNSQDQNPELLSVLELTQKEQQRQQESGTTGDKPLNYYDMFLQRLAHIYSISEEEGHQGFCMVQTKGQIKQNLERVKDQMVKTEKALATMKELEQLKAELGAFGIPMNSGARRRI